MKLEEFFDIEEYPPYSCPLIDQIIKHTEDANVQIKGELDHYNRYGEIVAEDFEHCMTLAQLELNEIPEKMEDLRSLNENLRSWGSGWKEVAMKAIQILDETHRKSDHLIEGFNANNFPELNTGK